MGALLSQSNKTVYQKKSAKVRNDSGEKKKEN